MFALRNFLGFLVARTIAECYLINMLKNTVLFDNIVLFILFYIQPLARWPKGFVLLMLVQCPVF
jgi:hypothetical protein